MGHHRVFRQSIFTVVLDIGEVHGELLHNYDEEGTRLVTKDGCAQLSDSDRIRRKAFLEAVHCRRHMRLIVRWHKRLNAHVPVLPSY